MKTINNPELLHRVTEAAKKGGVSRRDFLSLATAAGLTAGGASGLWSSSAMAAPKKGGTFKLGAHDGNTSDNHDPGTYVTFSMIQLAHTFRSYMTMINSDGTNGGDIASEWEASDDATEWTFKLNGKATFHTGAKVTPNDVIASMNHHRGEGSTSAAKALLADVVELVPVGDDAVKFVLGAGNADLPWLLTDYHLPILPAKADGSMEWASGVGSGPYKLVDTDFGVGYRLVRHDGWHLEGAWFDEIELTVLNDPNARQAALATGDVDAVTQLDLKTLGLLRRNPNIEIDNVPSGSAITMPMHVDVAPFDNVKVRKALKLAINREEIIEKIAFGTATIGNDFHHSPAMPYWPDDIPQHTYDPDQAKALLKEAGAEGIEVNLSVADSVYSGAVDMCVLYGEQAKAAGITINVVREPNDGYYSDVWLKKPWCAVQWGSRPTPDVMYSLAYKDDAAWNESHWKNPRFNELLRAAKAELDETKRTEMYREMAMLAHDDGGTVIPMFPNFVYAHHKSVAHGPDLAPSWQMDGARACSRWWFA